LTVSHHSNRNDIPLGGAEIATTGKCNYGKVKYKNGKMGMGGKSKYGCARMENASTEN